MKYSKILIDGHNLYYRNYKTNSNLSVDLGDGVEFITGGIYGFLRSVKKLEREYLADHGQIYFLFDNTFSKESYRKDLYAEYKANRVSEDKNFYLGIVELKKILMNRNNNYFILYKDGCEADDFVEYLIDSFPSYDKTLLLSNDLDWARGIQENVTWMAENVEYGIKEFEEKYGFVPSRKKIVLWKSIRGDRSDNIPAGIPRIQSKHIKEILDSFSTVNALIDFAEKNQLSMLNDHWRNKIIENKNQLRLNSQLISFMKFSQKEVEESTYKTSFNPELLRRFYHGLSFKISQIDERLQRSFVKPSKENEKEFFQTRKVKRI